MSYSDDPLAMRVRSHLNRGRDFVIFSKTTFGGGSSSGQTLGLPPSVVLREDPTLIRLPINSDALISHLASLQAPVPDIAPAVPNKAIVSIPVKKFDPTILTKMYILWLHDLGAAWAGSLGLGAMAGDFCFIMARAIIFRFTGLRDLAYQLLTYLLRKRSFHLRLTFNLPKLTLVPKFTRKKSLAFVGQGMTVFGIIVFLMTVGPIIRLQAGEWWRQSERALSGKAQEPVIRETLMDVARKPQEVPPAEKQFQILIPKIGINSRVVANVDASDEVAYQDALKLGVAHARGSGLPGEENVTNRTIYIFGHSTNGIWNIERYNALFYSLKDLSLGDEIIVWFWGKEFRYLVTNIVKVDPSDLTYLQPQIMQDKLVLQTCWPPGTVWKRLLVVAVPQ